MKARASSTRRRSARPAASWCTGHVRTRPAGAGFPGRGRERVGLRPPGHGRGGRRAARGRPLQALLRRRVRRRVVVERRAARGGARPPAQPLRVVDPRPGRPRSSRPTRHTHDIATTGASLGAFHAVNFALKRADVFPLAIGLCGNYDPATWNAWGERGEAAYFNNPMDYVAHLGGDHLDWLRWPGQRFAGLRPGHVGGHHRIAGEHQASRRAAGREGPPPRARPLGS